MGGGEGGGSGGGGGGGRGGGGRGRRTEQDYLEEERGMRREGGRRKRGGGGLFVCVPHLLLTHSALYCVLQIYTQDVGLECFPGKKNFFFQVSVCFHEQE